MTILNIQAIGKAINIYTFIMMLIFLGFIVYIIIKAGKEKSKND